MACEMRRERLVDLVAGELPEGEALTIEQHLGECAACRAEVNALHALAHPFLSEEAWQPDAAMADRVLAAGRAEGWGRAPAPSPAVDSPPEGAGRDGRPHRPRFPWRARLSRPLPAYATCLMVGAALAGGILLGGGLERRAGRGRPAADGLVAAERTPARPRDGSLSRTAGADSASPAAKSGRHRDVPVASARRPIAFTAVYTDGTRLVTSVPRDSF